MSNSSLVSFTKISPNKTSPRNHAIDTITIHCVVGQVSVESLGRHFSSASLCASSNYGVGYDGRIGMYVEEKDRSWCSSNAANDNRAITIEVASDTKHPYAVNDVAYAALIKLVADICKRNNIKELKWKADKSLIGQVDKQNMTVHRWFANKSCPGDYLYNRHGDIADRVNKLLCVTSTPKDEPTNKLGLEIGDTVKLVKGATYISGKSIPAWVFDKTLYVRKINGNNITVSTLKSGAVTGVVACKYLTKTQNAASAVPVQLAVGDVVQLISGAKYTTGKSVPDWAINSKLYARKIQKDYVVVSTLKTGDITGAVPKKYVLKNGQPIVADKNEPASIEFNIGDAVKLVPRAKYSNGQPIPAWMFGYKLYVRQLNNNDQVVISTLKTGAVTGVVCKKDLVKA